MSLYAGRRDVAERLLGRDASGDLAVEAVRPKSDLWRFEVEHDLARSVIGQVARHHFDEGDLEGDVWLIAHIYAERLVEALAHHDEAAVLALVAQQIRTTEKKENNHV